jgi:type IV pilus assembly protein PilZ
MAKKSSGKSLNKKNAPGPVVTGPTKLSQESRQGHRVPINLLVDYQSGGTYLFDFCRDLGTGGVFVETTQPQAHGSVVQLTFTIPDSKETLHAEGQVIWVQAAVEGRADLVPGMGIQFRSFSESQRQVLDAFVSRYRSSGNTGKKSA